MALGEPMATPDGELTRLFPTPAAVAERAGDVLTGPRRRIEAIRAAAAELASGDLIVDAGRDPEELRAQLRTIPGIGPWTADYVVLRVLGATDVLLTTDLAIRRGATALGLPAHPDGLARWARRWQPWRSYAGMHLWRAAAVPAPRLPRQPSQRTPERSEQTA
jgi:AraC family transcriptional regulator of adaptative response / DNA-3-methyladenine glycosylase II